MRTVPASGSAPSIAFSSSGPPRAALRFSISFHAPVSRAISVAATTWRQAPVLSCISHVQDAGASALNVTSRLGVPATTKRSDSDPEDKGRTPPR